MSRIAVVTDTTQYLPREVIERHGHPPRVALRQLGRADRSRDRPRRTTTRYYDFLRSGGRAAEHVAAVASATSSPSTSRWSSAATRSSRSTSRGGISGTVRAAEQARELLIERGMAAEKMVVVDSLTGLRRPRLHGGRRGQRARAAAPTSRARSPPRRRCARTCKIIVMVDTLEYLRRGGRIGAARGVDRRDAEGQADPHDRGRDAARRARAHRGRARSSGSSRTSSSAARTAATGSPSSTSRRAPRPSAWPSAAARSTGATRS